MIKEETLLTLLPGFNCGACGYVNCATFASALKEKRAVPEQCPVFSQERFVEQFKKLTGMMNLAGIEEKQHTPALLIKQKPIFCYIHCPENHPAVKHWPVSRPIRYLKTM